MSLKDDIQANQANKNESSAIFLAQQIQALQATSALKVPTSFTPTTGTDWSPAPTTIQIALDQLAARVKLLGG